MPPNQNPEQIARDRIDRQLALAGWVVQDNRAIDFNADPGIAVREYRTDVGPADYVLFVNGQAAGVIEAKAEEQGHKLTTVEDQSGRYASAKLKWVNNNTPLPLVCEATGIITRLTDNRDPKPRAREIFNFPTPAAVAEQLSQSATLRARLQNLPPLNPEGLRACQVSAITNLEASFQADHPRALVQMATGSGKTFTAITAVYRLLKHAGAQRVLFLVDTKNLGEQAEQEFMSYLPNDDNRKFTELYTVQRLKSSYVAPDSQVCISTIQRLYSLLKDEPLDEAAEEANPAEQDEELAYSAKQLDRAIVNPDQIRTVIRAFKAKLPEIFPGRREVPKTLIFAKTDSHADDIIHTVRREFGEGNQFCKKITYQAEEDPKSVLAQFRNDFYPRIAVTVDMIATGTDVKPLECLLFMRDVKSRNYFEQMKGRGTRTLDADGLKKVTPSAPGGKNHYVIVDAVGVTKSLKTASQPLITKPSVALKDLAMGVMMGARDEDTVSSLAGRLARLDRQLDDHDRRRISDQAGGVFCRPSTGWRAFDPTGAACTNG
ncbi:DEAD/DEAH box helicase family protein [Desulfurivibrio alkaliphilus]|nr:DEAD/DEAH box helicase family protein [Desulfurivibrio alkaliphilus]MDF1615744.1 DEAD/DEAH box helicase family protein [Desulfurivibrio alkaliphilus]